MSEILLLEEYARRVVADPDPEADTFVYVIGRHPRYFGKRFGGWKGEVRHYYRAFGGGIAYHPLTLAPAITRRGLLLGLRAQMSPHKPGIVPKAIPVFEVPWEQLD